MIAYKVFNSDWTCRGFKYNVGETYEEDIDLSLCNRGFHFCKKLNDCFNYYQFNPNNKVAKVEALGDVVEGSDKCCTNKIKIVKELTWYEVLEIVNIGEDNTGLENSGNGNTGNRNTGDRNTGNRNTGNYNTGYYNTGLENTGNGNTGYYNTGYYNTGNWNTGYYNTGNRNSGYYNSGNYNSGDGNSGNWNSGDFNISNHNTGCFNVDDHKLIFFDKETEMTWNQWRSSRAYSLLCAVDSQPTGWIREDEMTDREKVDYPTYKTTGRFLKTRDVSNAYRVWWDELSENQKQCIREIPNFDAKKFHQITGIPKNKLVKGGIK